MGLSPSAKLDSAIAPKAFSGQIPSQGCGFIFPPTWPQPDEGAFELPTGCRQRDIAPSNPLRAEKEG